MLGLIQRLARFLDRPAFPWKRLILGFSLAKYFFQGYLSLRQYSVLQQKKPPSVLRHEISQEVFDKSQAYGRARAKFWLVNGIWNQLQNLAFYHFDLLPKLWEWSGRLLLDWAPQRFTGEVSQSIVFLLATIVLNQLLSLPASVYETFWLEAEFGFNKQTPQVFITDILKGQLLVFTIIPPVLAAFSAIIRRTNEHFFYYVWLFNAGLEAFLVTIFPTVIQPLFNKLTPVEDGTLKSSAEDLAKKLKFPLHELFVIDGSRRSSHSNAYFFGLPWKKHIVIFDTLIEQSESEEVMAVLAHELGHWSLGHTSRLFTIDQARSFYVFTLFSLFINNNSLYASYGFQVKPMIVGYLLFRDALAPMGMIIKLLMNILSRRYEFEADSFARNLGYEEPLASSLIKMHKENLGTIDADWMYANYHYSHPILSERLKALDWQPTEKVEIVGSGEKGKERDGELAAVATGRDEL
ncbi:zinc metalloprotease [Sporothrix epigloea]|uniref:CAAX prenyl protease n=1 Tax=Sporothrix epigloea TaxID=1892477 RepID=A0ABP0DW22_9PEZI